MSVYKIYNAAKCYIGSTEQKMNRRINGHKYESNTCTSKLITCESDWDWVILENNVPLDQLKIRETHWFDITPNKVNKYRPILSEEERLEYYRKYNRQYKKNNKEANKERNREYHEKNKDAINAKKREYREKNKDAINAKKREKYNLAKQQECVTTS